MKKKKNLIDQLLEKAWKEFSIYIRSKEADFSGNVSCFTCPKQQHWRLFDAGHFKHGWLDFNEKNIHRQCTACNRFGHGRLDVYATNLIRKYGPGILEELDKLKNEERQRKPRYTKEELEKIIKKYKEKNLRHLKKIA